MIFLSKGNKDPYVNAFAKGCRCQPTNSDNFNFDESTDPIILRGILKKKIIYKCWESNRTFYYMDTGYFGNEITEKNPNGWKYWHRIVKNNLQHDHIVDRPNDRIKRFDIKINKWKKDGRKILIAAPDEKPMKFYGLNLDDWLNDTLEKIKSVTDRPIEIRNRDKNRIDRTVNKPFLQAINDDVFALVTFNSNAAIESVLQGIPIFTTSPVHAAGPVGLSDLSSIESPFYPDKDFIYKWLCHLSYGQFHVDEIRTGRAMDMINKL